MSEVEKEENLVKKTCRELGITQKELAEIMGVSKTTLSDWSVGKTPISKLGLKTLELLIIEKEFINFKKTIGSSLKLQNQPS